MAADYLEYDTHEPVGRMGNGWTMYEGDCMRVLPTLRDAAFDAVVTDPPYGISFQSNRRIATKQLEKIQNDERPFIWFLNEAYRVTKDGGHLICFCRWDTAEAFKLAIGWAGWIIKSQVIWDRDNHGSGDLNGSFAPQHDIIWHATKGKGELYGIRPTSVIRSMRVAGQNLTHPNEKPVPLMRYLIRAVTQKGGAVLDPFAGSGSTGKACILEGRDFVGVELDHDYFVSTSNALSHDRQTSLDFFDL